jgi:hypothetical protein
LDHLWRRYRKAIRNFLTDSNKQIKYHCMGFIPSREVKMNGRKGFLLCAALFVLALALSAQTPQWEWAVHAGGTGSTWGYNTAVDSQGNQFVTGDFYGTTSFGPYTLTCSGNLDGFVAKLDPAGNWLWAFRVGGIYEDSVRSIALDGSDNIWLTGYFSGTVTFGPYVITATGNRDIFAAKTDPDGNWLWAVSAESTSYSYSHGSDISVDEAGNAYLTGYFSETASFGPHILTSSGSHDIFTAKLDPDGNWLWAVKAGGTNSDSGNSIEVDSVGNAWLAGEFSGVAKFGDHTLTSNGSTDIVVAKLDPAGNWIWVVNAGSGFTDGVIDMTVDGSGYAYLTGFFIHTATFGENTLTSSGSYHDIFVAKLDPDSNWLWAVKAGSGYSDSGRGIAVDWYGYIWLTGSYRYTATFGTHTLYSIGSPDDNDIFAAELDPAGNWLWAVRAGGTEWEIGNDIAVDFANTVFLTGFFRGTASFGDNTFTSSGWNDAFAAKIIISWGTPVEDESIPAASLLTLSASPNPFAASTAITVAGGKPEQFSDASRIDIYDIRGRKVRSLALEGGSGNMSLPWDGRDERGQPCPNGIYLARLELGGRRATLKLSLVK